ncbi:hypothetical protein [Flavobacterium lindanitolerans]|uniref:DUF4082 domain-containing protein n=1 Tax=Flavobacterium lindanitolerans TaxID=428988 RepID=A0A497UZK8_9FLAO|nr:hypothetical protein [Flavobacterium lindanitolerans]PKW29151.1 hypothetical protein B0G92_0781 [Flavobacterium lindanitolerans]RLJ35347.1 hypothetical protein CLV50_0725 [Flavobacterium lindanitolerans]
MKTSFTKIGLVFLGLFATISCNNDDNQNQPVPAGCNTANSEFSQLYTTTLASDPSFTDVTTMDLQTHEYTFVLSANKTVCSIGYQGNANLYTANIPYLIEIVDNSTNTVVYSGNHVFDSALTDYVSITPTALTAGTSYTLKRTVTNYLGNIGNTVGRLLRFNGPSPYPVSNTLMTITASDFYGTGGPVPDFGIPYIDIVFQ